MPRSTSAPASRRRRKRLLDQAKGFRGARSKNLRQAYQAVSKAMATSTAHRRKKKGDYRRLWIMRVSAACREEGISYSRFIEGTSKAGIALNRKMLSEIAIHDPEGFKGIVAKIQAA